MVDDRRDFSPPEGWRDREDGSELVAGAFVAALKNGSHADLVEYADIAAEFADYGMLGVATQMVRGLLSRIAMQKNRPADEVLALLDSNAVVDASGLMDILGDPQTLLDVRILGLIAHLARAQNRNNDALRHFMAAAEAAGSLGFELDEAINYQSLGALYSEIGDLEEATSFSDRALDIYASMGDWGRLIATRLNQVQVLISQERYADAELVLDQLREPVLRLRDGHYSASWKRCGLLIEIKQGQVNLARAELVKLYQSRMRAGDLRLAETLARDIAILTEDVRDEKAAVPWWRKALTLSQRLGDHHEQQIMAHALAVALLRDNQFEDAIAAFSVSLDADSNDVYEDDANQALADRGTAHLAFALDLLERAKRRTKDAKANAEEAWTHLATAESELLRSIEFFHATRDIEWSLRTATNLRAVWIAANKLSYGAQVMGGWARQVESWDSGYAASLYRLAATLNVEPGQDSELASSQLLQAAEIDAREQRLDASAVLADAHILARSDLSLLDRLAAFDRAIALARQDGDMALVGDILNDSALVAVEEQDWDKANDRLRAADEVAEQSSNRVLAAMVKGNLGEIYSRQSQFEIARQYFAEASALAEQVGDLESAADSMASSANSMLSLGKSAELEQAVRDAETLAERSRSSSARARARSSRASLLYSKGEFSEAFRAWEDASKLVEPSERHEYRRLALEALVAEGDYSKFNVALERYFRAAQAEGTQLLLAGQLWHVVSGWLKSDRVQLAAKVLAYSVLLAIDGYSSLPNREEDDTESVRARDLLGITTALAPARIYLEWEDELGPLKVARLNRHFEKYVRSAIEDPKDAEIVIDLVHTFGDGWEEDDD
ncbi:tetratricopeptide repeat protein [Aeromicrobium sp. 9AM]|uniref:tetratricopeptide repeat protein n=1 Tax=Aeromicrobium sp. 9AM TaxID=2653126 RepID=UPI001359CE58|nr:tetratricopeptide repeat protein [Aeromicrobium sp. 9AM]